MSATPISLRRRGRPPGNFDKRPMVLATLPRCPACGSTERTRYENTLETLYGPLDDRGQPCTHKVRKSCRCLSCNLARVDRFYLNKLPHFQPQRIKSQRDLHPLLSPRNAGMMSRTNAHE